MLSETKTSVTEGAGYLILSNVSKHFAGFKAVNNVSLDIRKGEIFALLGASGCGKSTLLRMLAGFETASGGSLVLDGLNLQGLPPYQRPINMMFQSYALFPHFTVAQNLAYGLKRDGLAKTDIQQQVATMLELVQMQHLAKRKPHQLSGGQQQRVALARALIKKPKLLLLDEPMGALDKKLRSRMQLEIANIIESLSVTCVMVTHDQEEAMTMADRIAIMHEGEICQVGTPTEIYEQPNSRYTAEFIGSVNVFAGEIGEDQPDFVTVLSADLTKPLYIGHGVTGHNGQAVSVAIRPEKINISLTPPDQPHNCAQGIIQDIAYLGSHSVYHIELASGKIIQATALNAQRWAGAQLTWDQTVWIYWSDAAGVVLTA